jgi:hypothetical protein
VNSSSLEGDHSPATSDGSPATRVDKRRTSGASDAERRKSARLSDEADHTMASPSPAELPPSSSSSSPVRRRRRRRPRRHVDLATYPAQQLLRLLASLLTQIASANDALRQSSSSQHGPRSPLTTASPVMTNGQEVDSGGLGGTGSVRGRPFTASRSAFTSPSSTLCFHARNIPSIAIEQYLGRILKCESSVFLPLVPSFLFDPELMPVFSDCPTTNEVFVSLLVYFDRMARCSANTSSTFAIDSYNVHRLIIAGVTVASKFFSDVFYTNSRYAKVISSSLPLPYVG